MPGLLSDWEQLKRTKAGVLKYPIPQAVQRNFQREINTTVLLGDDTFKEYQRFHLLKELTREDQPLVPSHLIKLAWEYHIIETAAYRRFCFDCFGHFVHSSHLPRKVDEM